uniref:Uncharacterized protein n=1 Tax=Romanomermis culicivorax TaxID=13658 RepID=A0A915HIY9_ROMCU
MFCFNHSMNWLLVGLLDDFSLLAQNEFWQLLIQLQQFGNLVGDSLVEPWYLASLIFPLPVPTLPWRFSRGVRVSAQH